MEAKKPDIQGRNKAKQLNYALKKTKNWGAEKWQQMPMSENRKYLAVAEESLFAEGLQRYNNQ